MADTFSRDLALFVQRAKANQDLVLRKVCLDLYRSLVMKSPVGNPDLWKHPRKGYVGGRFRANWQVGVGVINSDMSNPPDADVESAVSRAEGALQDVKVGGVIYITSSLPYAQELEYGHSTQAPAGMLRLTVQEYGQYLEKAVAQLKT
jgi:hypothetical protein